MRLTIGYSDSEDRIWLRAEDSPAMWWITRRLALNLVAQWAALLEKSAVSAPSDGEAEADEARRAAAAQRVRQERSRAIASTPKEPADQGDKPPPGAVAESFLLSGVNLRASPKAVQIELVASSRKDTIGMSRDEAHRLLDALVARAQRSAWFEVRLPDWVREGRV